MTSSLVRDVMTTEVVTAEPSTPFKEIAGLLAQHRISAVPVVDAGRRVLGIVTEADLLLKQEHPDPKADVSLIWTRRRRRERNCDRDRLLTPACPSFRSKPTVRLHCQCSK